MEAEIIHIIEETIGENLHSFGFGKEFWDTASKAWAMEKNWY